MITKKRLEELIEQDAKIYLIQDNKIGEVRQRKYWIVGEDRLHWYCDKRLYIKFDTLFETKEEAEWVAKMHTSRTEYFKPPFELKDNEKYKFTTAKGGKMSISKFVYRSGEVQWWLSYVGTHRTFYSYQEAVDYARKLFKGEKDE